MWLAVGAWKYHFLRGWQCHSTSFSCRDLRIISWSNCWMACIISLSAPAKLVPLSLQISLVAPPMQIKHHSAWMNESVSKDPTSSTCIALEVKQTKMQPYTFSVARPGFTWKGAKKSSPVKVNGGSYGTSLDSGRSPIIWFMTRSCLLRQGMQLRSIRGVSTRVLMIQNFWRNTERTCSRPACPRISWW